MLAKDDVLFKPRLLVGVTHVCFEACKGVCINNPVGFHDTPDGIGGFSEQHRPAGFCVKVK